MMRLNPCFTGCFSSTSLKMKSTKTLTLVLILVLLDASLRQDSLYVLYQEQTVLILVLLDASLRPALTQVDQPSLTMS